MGLQAWWSRRVTARMRSFSRSMGVVMGKASGDSWMKAGLLERPHDTSVPHAMLALSLDLARLPGRRPDNPRNPWWIPHATRR